MNANEIGTEAGRIFEYNLPSNWIFRSQEDQNDFGIDGEIELKCNTGKALGKDSIFKVQIKGEENSTYINEGNFLSFPLKVEKLKYYLEFKIPVIFVVVEISSEKIFWLSLTNNDSLRNKLNNNINNETIQIHLPIENTIIRKNDEHATRIITTVSDCWEYLAIKGLKNSVDKYQIQNTDLLNQKIEDIGEILFKVYHQKLNNLLINKDFNSVFQQASEIVKSEIVPIKDRFIALLYYWQAFQIAPHTKIKKEIIEENLSICHLLTNLARKQKSKIHRIIAIGKYRKLVFQVQLEQLNATHHSINNFEQGSFEYFIFNSQTHEIYRKTCMSLQKIIELCNRLTKASQYHILSDIYVDIYPLILMFKDIHRARGSNESIEFLEQWQENMVFLIMQYCIISKDVFKIEQLYYFIAIQLKSKSRIKELIISSFPKLKNRLIQIEKSIEELNIEKNFNDLSIEEQKSYFLDKAKNLGMDPDDPENKYGQFVALGLKNYDPTSIMKNCKSLFVHYRPAGLIAQSLGMHSAGAMHLLICLKHGYCQATGNLLTYLYDNTDGPNLGLSFKQQHCENCTDCESREKNWNWSLSWYKESVTKNEELLNKYKF